MGIVTLNRRQFLEGSAALAGLGLMTSCGLLPSRLKPWAKVPRIGYVSNDETLGKPYDSLFFKGLEDRGWVDGQNVTIDKRFVQGDPERGRAAVTEFLGM